MTNFAQMILQAAKTYLEKKFDSFPSSSLDELIRHGLRAIQACLQDGELSSSNSSIAIVGKDMSFTILEDAALDPYVAAIKEEDLPPAAAEEETEAAPAAAQEEAEAMPVEGGAAEEDEGPRPMEI